MESSALGTRSIPAIASHATLVPGAGVSPTVAIRPEYRVVRLAGPSGGVAVDDPYVRRFWVAAVGAGAVADLLRLVGAGRRKQTVRRPLYLHVLAASGLALVMRSEIAVPDPLPVLPAAEVRRLPAALRREHAAWLLERSDRRAG